MTATHPAGAPLLSRLFAFLLPLLLAAYWPFLGFGQSAHARALVIRLACLAGAAALSLLWTSSRLTAVELKWTGWFGAYLAILILSAALGEDFTRGIHNWFRLLPVYGLAVALARPLRHTSSAHAFGIALSIAGLLSFLFIAFVYAYYAGFQLPTYEHVREFKAIVQRTSGIALNPLASATLFFLTLSLCLVKSSWVLRIAYALIAVLTSALTGSRAPLALLAAGVAAVAITRLFHGRSAGARTLAVIAAILSVLTVVAFFWLEPPAYLSGITEGRYDVWTVGIQKFLERPLTGYGAGSWLDDLGVRLPGYYKGTSGLAAIQAGGYHSEFVTLLAEGGLICFVPAMILFALLFRGVCRVANAAGTPWFQGSALLLAFFFLFFRASVEVPGLFGYGEDVNDYLAAMFAAIVISRESLVRSGPPLRKTYPRVAAEVLP